ncbi:single-minded homolog 1, partial [Striga asiatica]
IHYQTFTDSQGRPFHIELLPLPVMDPRHSADVLKHLEKQKELIMDAYRSMSDELHKLQVEEEMLMRKYYEFMAAQGLMNKVKGGTDLTEDGESSRAGAIVTVGRD